MLQSFRHYFNIFRFYKYKIIAENSLKLIWCVCYFDSVTMTIERCLCVFEIKLMNFFTIFYPLKLAARSVDKLNENYYTWWWKWWEIRNLFHHFCFVLLRAHSTQTPHFRLLILFAHHSIVRHIHVSFYLFFLYFCCFVYDGDDYLLLMLRKLAIILAIKRSLHHKKNC